MRNVAILRTFKSSWCDSVRVTALHRYASARSYRLNSLLIARASVVADARSLFANEASGSTGGRWPVVHHLHQLTKTNIMSC